MSIGLSVQQKRRKIDFQDGGHSSHLGFSTGMILAIFDLRQPSFKSIGLPVQEKKRKIDFKDGHHLRFLIRSILIIFDVQVTPMLSTKF